MTMLSPGFLKQKEGEIKNLTPTLMIVVMRKYQKFALSDKIKFRPGATKPEL
jgi:hypothetical protein